MVLWQSHSAVSRDLTVGGVIYKYEKKTELPGALHDAVKAYQFLYVKGSILDCGISKNNVIITDSKKTDVDRPRSC